MIIKIIIALVAIWGGMALGYYLKCILDKNRGYFGIINVLKEEEKITYSLELDGDPELLQFENEVSFKVVTSEVVT